jgi:hypothetical protein
MSIKELQDELIRLRNENYKLKVMLAKSKADCFYCGLPVDRTTECESGFPGCERMNDVISDPAFLSGSTQPFNYVDDDLTPTVKYNLSPSKIIPPEGISRIDLHKIDPDES